MKITILEDNELLLKQIAMVLQKEGYQVETFSSPDKFFKNFDKNTDLLLLDINLPEMNGLEVFEILQSTIDQVKTIFMTSYDDIDHIKQAFKLGCEDYLKKPFELEELLLRIEKVKKTLNKVDSIIKLGKYEFDLENYQVYFNKKYIKITKQEAELLKVFLLNLGKVVTFDYLNEKIWDMEVTTNTITVAVLRLKKKLNLKNLENIREVGYIFHKL
jgi:DNA-binding response OmpR family regulator